MEVKPLIFFVLSSLFSVIHASAQRDAFPLVHREPFHKPLYQDETIRILDVSAEKNDTTSFHLHCLPILYITLSGSQVALQTYENDWKRVTLPTGWIGHDIYDSDSCFTHRFSVVGESMLQIVAVEVLQRSKWKPINSEVVYKEGGFSLIRLENYQVTNETDNSCPIILLEKECMGHCKIRVTEIKDLTREDFDNYTPYQVNFDSSD